MLKQERQKQILSLVEEYTYLTIAQLAQKMDVSEMTIRRDVTEMDKGEKLIKLYGGVQKSENSRRERKVLTTEEKYPENIVPKTYIGKIVNSIVKDNMTIFVGAGTTMLHALPEIQAKNLCIITSSLLAFNYLKDHTNHRVILTGGEFYPVTDEFFGTIAKQALENINIDIAFGATNGVYGNSATASRMDLGDMNVAAFSKSRIKCLLADSSKLGVADTYSFFHLENLDYLITDNEITDAQKAEYGKFVTILSEEVKEK